MEMVTFKHLIIDTDFSQVWECIARHYEIRAEVSIDNYKGKYKDLYEKLATLIPADNSKNMYIYINVFKDDGYDDYYCPDSFDENDKELYCIFRVHPGSSSILVVLTSKL
jgi:hypothetical protein